MIQEINLTAIIITAIICFTVYAISRDDTGWKWKQESGKENQAAAGQEERKEL